MATTFSIYNQTHQLLCGELNWITSTIKCALLYGGGFSATDTIFADVSYAEVESGNGYTTGGASLLNKTKTNSKLTADGVSFTALTKSFSFAVLYAEGTIDSIVNPLLAWIEFDDTPNEIVVAGDNFNILWNSNGIFTL